jgi:predicted Zn-ribbon and HTH transcriptional regulator
MKLKCSCGYEWDYKGKMKKNATCPDCRALVKIPEDLKK